MRIATAFLSASLLVWATGFVRANDAWFDAAQATISGQFEAFLADDPATAYSFAAPNIQSIFPTQELFMGMVATAYPQVHRARSFSFGKAEVTGEGTIAQQVMIVGLDGREYEAVYTLQMQEDGSFLITGVHLRAAQTMGA